MTQFSTFTTTGEADRLALELARLTGETPAEAVTRALRDQLEREKASRGGPENLAAVVAAYSGQLKKHYDFRPVTRQEWDEASGDDIE